MYMYVSMTSTCTIHVQYTVPLQCTYTHAYTTVCSSAPSKHSPFPLFPLPSLHWLTLQVLRNQEMRVKFPDLPEKFMESELELNEELQSLHVIATTPEYYSILMEVQHPPPTCMYMYMYVYSTLYMYLHASWPRASGTCTVRIAEWAHKVTHLSDLYLENGIRP